MIMNWRGPVAYKHDIETREFHLNESIDIWADGVSYMSYANSNPAENRLL